jgi:hypothetical protein
MNRQITARRKSAQGESVEKLRRAGRSLPRIARWHGSAAACRTEAGALRLVEHLFC